jgi:mannose-6-phosphate isomerase-like protein (cupin superfamily)
VGLDHFFTDERQRHVVAIARRSERIRFPDISSGLIAYHFESLDFKATERKLNAFYADFQPVAAEKLKMHTHAGVELVYLIRGKLELCIGSEIHTLESGDAIYFDSAVRHKYRAVGKKPCSGRGRDLGVTSRLKRLPFRDQRLCLPRHRRLCAKGQRSRMTTLKVARNILGTVGLLFAGYVFLSSFKDARRYLKISSM